MAIISKNKKSAFRGYDNTQFRYAMVYVIITFVVLLFLNIYCSRISHMLFYQSKESFMIEKCNLASDEIANLEVISSATLTELFQHLDTLKASRIIVTDQFGIAIYDSLSEATGTYILFPEVIQALDGNDVFSWNYRYRTAAMDSRAAIPIMYYDTLIGCVYMTEYDTSQGLLLHSLQKNVLQITLILEIIVVLFSLAFSAAFSHRLKKIMASMRIIQNGDYTHKLNIGGNDELTILGKEFNDLTDRLQTSEQKRSRFVSDASHELKTPLASIKLLTDSILQNDMDAPTMREFVEDIGNEADRLTRMTEKMLSLTKVDGRDHSESEIIYMSPTIQRVHRMLSPIAKQANIIISLDLEEDAPVLILEDDLYQIVFNLMENGIKYNQPGGALWVQISKEEDNAVLTIRDSGVGIPEDAVGHIFERFYRVDKARSRATGGSGLGLAIVRTIVQRNRGEIQVQSTPGVGTTFSVIFPTFDTEVDRT